MKKNQIISIIIGALILAGLVGGFSYQLGQKSVGVAYETSLPNVLESKVIQRWSGLAAGRIIEISGRNVTLSSGEETIDISIREDAPVYRVVLVKGETETPAPAAREEVEFEDVKVGDRVNVSCLLKTDAPLEGIAVTILP